MGRYITFPFTHKVYQVYHQVYVTRAHIFIQIENIAHISALPNLDIQWRHIQTGGEKNCCCALFLLVLIMNFCFDFDA